MPKPKKKKKVFKLKVFSLPTATQQPSHGLVNRTRRFLRRWAHEQAVN